jgi:DNA-binding NarL/FixJ family response regulator
MRAEIRRISGETGTLHWNCRGEPIKLGPRECEILKVLLTGADNHEIAQQLGMARRTVKAHFNRLYLKFGISDRVKRVKLAVMVHRQREEVLGCESWSPDLGASPQALCPLVRRIAAFPS